MADRKKETCSICGAPCNPSTVGKAPACQRCRYERDRVRVAFDHAKATQEFYRQDSPVEWRDEHAISLVGNKPVVLAFTGDWHFGGMYVDYDALQDHLNIIKSTPNLHLITMGDLIDNTIGPIKSNVHPMFEQALSPSAQYHTLETIIQEIGPKLIASLWGNHDASRFERLIGYSPVADLLSKVSVYFRGIGRLKINLGGAEYRLLLTHHSNASKVNKFLAFNNLVRDYGAWDLIVTAHTHNNVGGWCRVFDNALVHYLRCGSFNKSDLLSARFFHEGTVEQPAAVIYPGEKRIVPFRCLEDAIIYARGANNE